MARFDSNLSVYLLIMLIQGNSSEINNEDFTYENEEELELLEDEMLFFMDEEEEDHY